MAIQAGTRVLREGKQKLMDGWTSSRYVCLYDDAEIPHRSGDSTSSRFDLCSSALRRFFKFGNAILFFQPSSSETLTGERACVETTCIMPASYAFYAVLTNISPTYLISIRGPCY